MLASNEMINAERQARFRAKKSEQECHEVRGIYAHKLDHAAIKGYAAKVIKKRSKADNVQIEGQAASGLSRSNAGLDTGATARK